MQIIKGHYYFPQSSRSTVVELSVKDETLSLLEGNSCLLTCMIETMVVRPTIVGVPLEIDFNDGGKFIALDNHQRLNLQHSNIEQLEKNKTLILSSIVLIPALMWFILTVAMPYLADKSVKLLPPSVGNQMGDQSFKLIEELFLAPSQLPIERQEAVKQQWQGALTRLSLPASRYTLHVYASEYFGPNAFALPNGTVVITDDLIKKLDNNPDAILAVLLHEIGHVERQHSLRIVAQSVSNTIAIAVIFGDVDTIGEVVLGVGSTLTMNAFSREMESEADDYALEKLVRLGKSPQAFSDAMNVFIDLKSDHESSALVEYLSTHPKIEERIKKAENFGF